VVGLISPQLNANETKDMDMVIDYRSPSSHLMTTTKGLDIEIVETHKYLVSSLTFYKIMFLRRPRFFFVLLTIHYELSFSHQTIIIECLSRTKRIKDSFL